MVPIGYLVGVALLAWCTFVAIVAPRRPWPMSVLSFRFGLVINELPFLAFYFLLASTLLAFGQGDIHSPGDWATFGLAVLTTAGLAVIDAGTAARLRRRLPLARILFAPVFVRRRDVERVANLRYGDAGKRNLLDVYRHRSRPSSGPILVYLHGGGYYSGRKDREGRPLLYRLASQGWVCISANYRLRPQAEFPDHLVDAKKVIAWAREHGPGYGGDPGVVFVAGSSAGGHLAALAALTPNDPRFQPGFERADTSIAERSPTGNQLCPRWCVTANATTPEATDTDLQPAPL